MKSASLNLLTSLLKQTRSLRRWDIRLNIPGKDEDIESGNSRDWDGAKPGPLLNFSELLIRCLTKISTFYLSLQDSGGLRTSDPVLLSPRFVS